HRRRAAAAMADSFELVDELRDAEQRRHAAERLPAEVLREAGRDDARPACDELLDRLDDPVVEELHLVDPDRVVARREAWHVHVRLPVLEAEARVEAVRRLAVRPGAEPDRAHAGLFPDPLRLTRQRLADALATGGLVDDHVLDRALEPRRDAVDDERQRADDA